MTREGMTVSNALCENLVSDDNLTNQGYKEGQGQRWGTGHRRHTSRRRLGIPAEEPGKDCQRDHHEEVQAESYAKGRDTQGQRQEETAGYPDRKGQDSAASDGTGFSQVPRPASDDSM